MVSWEGRGQTYHSRSDTDAVSVTGVDGWMFVFAVGFVVVIGVDVSSFVLDTPCCSFALTSFSSDMSDTSNASVNSFKRSLASALLSAGFLTLRGVRGTTGVFRCRRRTQNTHRL